MHTVENSGEGVAHIFVKIPGVRINALYTKFRFIAFLSTIFLSCLGGGGSMLNSLPPSPSHDPRTFLELTRTFVCETLTDETSQKHYF